MSLTGTPFFVFSVAMTLVAMVAMILLWNRVRGPRPVRLASRMAMIVLGQAAAVLAVLVWVNNTYGLYESWSDLLGDNGQVRLAAGFPGPDGVQGIAASAAQARHPRFTPGKHGVLVTVATGPRSRITGSIDVWLPPQYDSPAYRHTLFPVVELLPGYPGSPGAWFGAMGGQRELTALIDAHKAAPMILVAPKMNVLGNVDPGCANIPHRALTSTWLGTDVPSLVKRAFRVAPDARHWALMGYSAGAYCATNLALQHPATFHAVASLSGYNAPCSTLVTRDPALARANNPYLELRDAKHQPGVVLLMAGSYQDSDTVYAAKAVLAVLHHPGPSRLLTIARGGHNTAVWKTMLPTAFTWLSQQIAGGR